VNAALNLRAGKLFTSWVTDFPKKNPAPKTSLVS
jgi:hypothetical protein